MTKKWQMTVSEDTTKRFYKKVFAKKGGKVAERVYKLGHSKKRNAVTCGFFKIILCHFFCHL
jgi:hypothetical protein